MPCDGTASAWSWHAGRALLPFVFRLRLRERSPETHAGGEAACGDAPLAHLAHLAHPAQLAQPGTPRPLGTPRYRPALGASAPHHACLAGLGSSVWGGQLC